MASTITVTCPECDKQLKAPSDSIGKKIRCKACGATFSARAAAAKADKSAVAKSKSKDELEPDTAAYKMREEYIGRRCPYCANALEEEDRVCLNCGYNTLTREKASMKKIAETTGADITLWLIPGILCAFLVLIALGLCTWYWLGVDKESFGDEWYAFIGGQMMKMYATLLALFISWYAGKFAVKRLIFNYMPPEVEEKMEGALK
jgi:DNA-directed RNA polymerase subunit M/transcription elongation factor TFIIS